MPNPIKVRISSVDSGTGSEYSFDAVLPALTGEAVRDAVVADLAVQGGHPVDEVDDHAVAAFVKHGDHFAFILTTNECIMGDVVVAGIVYLL